MFDGTRVALNEQNIIQLLCHWKWKIIN